MSHYILTCEKDLTSEKGVEKVVTAVCFKKNLSIHLEVTKSRVMVIDTIACNTEMKIIKWRHHGVFGYVL